ncbi:MAG: BON domain-containing protein [Deltaproteobacteria bacterium]|jgi:hyperosmotically inducible periplasmic protein
MKKTMNCLALIVTMASLFFINVSLFASVISVNATETEVLAKDGTVILHSEATSAAQKDLATKYAKDVKGVKNVKNETTVLTTAMKPGKKTMGEKMDSMIGSIDDASITALVKTTLLYHQSTSVLNHTTVETKKGVVELGGKARNTAEKDLASKLVSDVYGVKGVVNNMTIKETKYERH